MLLRMFEGFTSETVDTGNGLVIAARVGGSGPPVLLLHGFPETHVCWHKVAPVLARSFTVVAPDLRGYGASSKPETTPTHEPYSKRAMAGDQVRLMQALGFERFFLAGHDRGGRVAHRLALDHPERVRKLSVLDIAPTETMYAATDRVFAEAYYHWFFLIQPFDLPERLLSAEGDYYLRRTMASWCKTEGAITEEAFAAYLAAWTGPRAIHAACEDYRAAATIDLEHDAADDKAGRKLAMPVQALWGGRGVVGRRFDVIGSWREKAAGEVVGEAFDCGHFLPEEAPDETVRALAEFFSSSRP